MALLSAPPFLSLPHPSSIPPRRHRFGIKTSQHSVSFTNGSSSRRRHLRLRRSSVFASREDLDFDAVNIAEDVTQVPSNSLVLNALRFHLIYRYCHFTLIYRWNPKCLSFTSKSRKIIFEIHNLYVEKPCWALDKTLNFIR